MAVRNDDAAVLPLRWAYAGHVVFSSARFVLVRSLASLIDAAVSSAGFGVYSIQIVERSMWHLRRRLTSVYLYRGKVYLVCQYGGTPAILLTSFISL